MESKFKINKPFFEIGPKTYLYGKEAVELAVAADSICEKYQVEIIFSAQYTDIASIVKETSHIRVFAQHMDSIYPGRGIGAVLPEAIKDAGADGVLLNHAEKPLSLAELSKCIIRAHEVGLGTLVCAGTAEEGAAVACLNPDIILAESPNLIGKTTRGAEDIEEIKRINNFIHKVNPDTLILHGAGISNEKDVFEIVKAGADATGSTSGIIKAEFPYEMMEKMIVSLVKAWKSRNK